MIPKCLNACIIASSFSSVHCGCLAFYDLAGLKFSPTSNPHFFLICAIYSDETLSPVCSSTYAFICSYVAFPLNSDKSISSREKSTFTFLLSTIPLESKTTVSTCVEAVKQIPGRHNFPLAEIYIPPNTLLNQLFIYQPCL